MSEAGKPLVVVACSEGQGDYLRDQVAMSPDYETRAVADAADLPETFDCCLCDRAGLAALGDELTRRRGETPYLPCLLVVTDESSETRSLAPRQSLTPPSDAVVDEVVVLPVDRPTLHRRIDSHLDIRRAAVRASETSDQYEQLLDMLPDAVLVARDGRIRRANDAAATLLDVGRSADLRGRRLSEFLDPSDATALEALADDVQGGATVDESRSLTFRTADGRRREAAVTGAPATLDGERAAQLVVRDRTVENDRQRRLGLFDRALDSMTQAVSIADAGRPDLPLTYVNPAFERVTGYPADEALGRNCRFLQGEATDPDTVDEIRTAIENERAVAVEIRNYRKDGTPFWNRLQIVPVADDSGTVTHFLGFQEDITAEVLSHQRLAVLDRVLRHNLGNRATVIRGQAKGIQQDHVDPSDGAWRIIEAIDELLDLSDQVRAFGGVVDSGSQDRSRVDLAALVERETTGLCGRVEGATVRVDTPDAAPVLAHETLSLAVGELLSFAVEDCETPLTVTVTAGERFHELRVVDTERGIPSPNLRALADRLESPLEHPYGLELWFVRWAVEFSGGEVQVDGLDGDGAVTIRIRLPAAGPDGG